MRIDSMPTQPFGYADDVYLDRLEAIRFALSRSLSKWAVTDEDVDRVFTMMNHLSPDEYLRCLTDLDRDGLLQRYLDESSPSQQRRFTDQLIGKGLLTAHRVPKAELPKPLYGLLRR